MKTRNLFFAFLLTVCTSAFFAQQKYDFASVTYNPNLNIIAVSINGKEYLERKAELPRAERTTHNQNALFSTVNELQDLGWEFIEFNTVGVNMFYYSIAYMKKKKA